MDALVQDLGFGWRTAVLSVAFGQLLLLALALLQPLENRLANRTLAALLVVLAGFITPWMIGFAGFYDKWRWFTFLPVSVPLAIAPLFYLYVHALVSRRLPPRWAWHIAPPCAQFAYLLACFVAIPTALKDDWLDRHSTVYDLLSGGGTMAGLVVYGLAAGRLINAFRRRLPDQVADEHRYALGWLRQAMAALFILLGTWTIYTVWDMVSPLGYTGLMGLYLALAGIALFLGIAGLSHADRRFPVPAPDEPEPPARDWQALGAQWAAATRSNRWHADPELTLMTLARRLGTNTSYLSRALNEGLGMNFATFINTLRSEDVAAAIDAGRGEGLLDLSLEAGFSSKASFNRSFQARFGMTPSQYRDTAAARKAG